MAEKRVAGSVESLQAMLVGKIEIESSQKAAAKRRCAGWLIFQSLGECWMRIATVVGVSLLRLDPKDDDCGYYC